MLLTEWNQQTREKEFNLKYFTQRHKGREDHKEEGKGFLSVSPPCSPTLSPQTTTL